MADNGGADNGASTSEKIYNIQATKEFIFNETGNIMMASTDMTGTIPEQVRDVFAEVSVFFAAMTKAISESMDPATGKPYSLYDYNAIQNVIDGSGLFVHVTEEDITHTSSSFGVTFQQGTDRGTPWVGRRGRCPVVRPGHDLVDWAGRSDDQRQ